MKVSVAVCTHNRASLLDGCLASLSKLDILPGTEWEVVVVNNASSDDTDGVIERHRNDLPLRGITEPRLGHSHARNRALDEVRGDLLLFLDDDVRPNPNWLGAHSRAMADHPSAAFSGGPVEPEFVVPPPDWVLLNLDTFLGVLALQPAEGRPLVVSPIGTAEELPYGANFGLRPSRLSGLRFDPDLGRHGPELTSGDETELLLSLLRRGEEGLWVPGALVRHLVGPERLDPAYVTRWFRAFGRVSAAAHPDRVPGRFHVRMRWLLTRTATALLSRRRDTRWMRALRRSAKARGILDWYAAKQEPRNGRPPSEG